MVQKLDVVDGNSPRRRSSSDLLSLPIASYILNDAVIVSRGGAP